MRKLDRADDALALSVSLGAGARLVPCAQPVFLVTCLLALGACSELQRSGSGAQLDAGADAGTGVVPTADASVATLRLSREQLMDPTTCQGCHPRHYREWASSMHAYAAQDPVFLAMNRRGQRETHGEMGAFCVNCHAPLAVREGRTRDGLNLAELPAAMQGVTCYFCHNAMGAEAPHNGKLTLANDTTMHGSLRDAVDPGVHGVAYSAAHDRNELASSALCGSCHDVVNDHGVRLERTYAEYLQTPFAVPGPDFKSCQSCHMPESREAAPVAEVADLGLKVPKRLRHSHLWPGVDVALDDFPERDVQRLAVECELMRGTQTVQFVKDGPNLFAITVQTRGAHAQPSGAAQDRRMWLEVVAYDQEGNEIDQVGELGALEPNYDALPTLFRDRIFDGQGNITHMFWEAAPSYAQPTGYTSVLLPFASGSAEAPRMTLPVTLLALQPARVTARLRMRPMGLDILEDLVRTGDLDPKLLAQMPTFTLYGTQVEWTPANGTAPITSTVPAPLNCPDEYVVPGP